jgi:hypothetical protein
MELMDTDTYSEVNFKKIGRLLNGDMKVKPCAYRLYNLILNKDIYYGTPIRYILKNPRNFIIYGEPTFIHTNYLKILNNDITGTSELYNRVLKNDSRYKDWLMPGEQIDIELPECIFKMPEDYL